MIVDDSGCLCETCLKSGYCFLQRVIGRLQEVAYNTNPEGFPEAKDVVLLFYVKSCPYVKLKA